MKRSGYKCLRMSNYISLPTIEQVNKENLLEVIKALDPQLYMIKIALDETGVNPVLIPHIIRVLGNLTLGAGYGQIQIYMKARVVTSIESTESIKFKEEKM